MNSGSETSAKEYAQEEYTAAEAAAMRMVFKDSKPEQPKIESSGSKNRRISMLVVMVFGLLTMMCVVSVVGALQMGKIQREVKRIAAESVPFIQDVSLITMDQLRLSLEIDRTLSRAEIAVEAGQPVTKLNTALEDMMERSKVIDARYSQAELLLNRIIPELYDEGDKQELAQLKSLLLRLESAEQHFERSVIESLKLLVAESGPKFDRLSAALVTKQREELAALQSQIELRSSEVFSEVQGVMASAIAKAALHHRNAKLAMATCAGLSLVFGLVLIFRLRHLQRELIQSEQMTVLARTLVTLHHEINNPLAVIVGNAQLLQCSGSPNVEQQAMLSTIQSMAMRVKEVLQKLSNLESVAFTQYVGQTEMLKIDSSEDSAGTSTTVKGPIQS